MEVLAVRAPGQGGEAPGRRRDLGLLALLLAAALGLHGWLLCHTEVAARDSIGFIRYALEFEKTGRWKKVLRHNHQHPGYPLTVLAVSWPVRAFVQAPRVNLMQFSAQLASALAGVLLVVPMYYLGKGLFDRATAFWATLLFQCLPVSGHILSDGLSEALFLLLTATALLFAVQALRDRSRGRFALCGVFCGLAYMTRPEGALLLVATGLVLLGLQASTAWRRPWRETTACGVSLALAALAAGSPYFLAIHGLTNKPAAHQLMGGSKTPPRAGGQPAGAGSALAPFTASGTPPLAVVLRTDGPRLVRLVRGLWGLGAELVNGFHYIAWAPALLGMWWYRRLTREVPGAWVLLILCLLHALVLWRLAVIVGYLSDRHIQVLVLCGIYPAVVGVRELPWRLRAWLEARGRLPSWPKLRWLLSGGAPLLSTALLVTFAGTAMPKTLQTLHGKRAGHRAAGLWLAEHAQSGDAIFDRHAWAHYYAGYVFREGEPQTAPPGHRPVNYHVVSKSKECNEPARDQPHFPSEKEVLELGATPVYHWPPNRPLAKAVIVVYVLARAPANPPRVPPEHDRDVAEEQDHGCLDPGP